MSLWAGLGYYSRARNLHTCAKTVADQHGGLFPSTEEELLKLPGIGPYTAAAIAAIAFGCRAVVVDANVERVTARLFAIAEPLPAARAAIRRAADAITPDLRAGDFAQAMMDLGATICTSKSPRCLLCPLADGCLARSEGAPERYPVKAAKKPRPERQGTAFWIEREGAVWLVKREGKGMLGGMRALPDDGWSARSDGNAAPPLAGNWTPMGTVQHGFTHFSLHLRLLQYSGSESGALTEGEWWPVAQLVKAGLPSLFDRAARLGLAGPRGDGEGP
jgi:A/G-specific adenine glycosylase